MPNLVRYTTHVYIVLIFMLMHFRYQVFKYLTINKGKHSQEEISHVGMVHGHNSHWVSHIHDCSRHVNFIAEPLLLLHNIHNTTNFYLYVCHARGELLL